MELRSGENTSRGVAGVTQREAQILLAAMSSVLDADNIAPEEFSLRLGPSRERGIEMARTIEGWVSSASEQVELDRDLVDVLAGALNEVVNGFDVPDLELTIGRRDEIAELHGDLRRIFAALRD